MLLRDITAAAPRSRVADLLRGHDMKFIEVKGRMVPEDHSDAVEFLAAKAAAT